MVLFRGPSSTISDPIGATHLPSDVPPPLSILVSILFISLIDDFTISMNSVFAVRNGRATGSPYKYIECYNSSGSSSAGESVGDYSFKTPHIGGAMYLTANQYVQLRAYCSNSTNLRIHSGIYTFWKGYLVG